MIINQCYATIYVLLSPDLRLDLISDDFKQLEIFNA